MLVRELGPGGVSRVFLGRDEVLDRPVAVKVVEPDPADPEVGIRFQREGRAAARLSHPNIVRVYDAGEDELDGNRVSYIVMEYVPCGDFRDMMDRNGPLPETMLSRVGGMWPLASPTPTRGASYTGTSNPATCSSTKGAVPSCPTSA